MSAVAKVGDAPSGPRPPDMGFTVVGVGASAGGLGALEALFAAASPDDVGGTTYVVVQHLSPDHKSLLAELVARHSRLKAIEIVDGMVVEPHRIYVIPPSRDLALCRGRLVLTEPAAPRGARLTVDAFFCSLAEELRERAIGIVLSGTGSDGAAGLRAIKAAGGMVMAQRPDTAEFDGMPRSAIETGLVDYVLAPGDMPAQLAAYIRAHALTLAAPGSPEAAPAQDRLLELFALVRAQTGHDFTQYKRTTVLRRIERRCAAHHVSGLGEYVALLRQDSGEVAALFRDFLIGVTHFFRDSAAFALLETTVIPRLFSAVASGTPLRVWVPACSTGEEAYSIAMLLREQLSVLPDAAPPQVFATDIDPRAVAVARAGLYPETIAQHLSPERLQRFFVEDPQTGGFRVQRSIRDLVVFSTQDVTRDPPFSRLDLISCRNALIYMAAPLQKKLIPVFHYALNPGGVLFLGSAETIGDHPDLFTPLQADARIYQRLESARGARHMSATRPRAPASSSPPQGPMPTKTATTLASLKALTEGALLHRLAGAAALVRPDGELLYLHGRTGQYLEPTPGEVRMNALAMAREGLQRPLGDALQRSVTSGGTVRCPGLWVRTNGSFSSVDLTVVALPGPAESRLYLLVFEDVVAASPAQPGSDSEADDVAVADPSANDARIRLLTEELRARDEHVLSARAEMQLANEALTAANEDLQSANEEMQSTNEELETSKEELQSVNEELSTVNAELQTKVVDLSRASDDMNNLLTATGIGTIYLDLQLHIQRFTPAVTRVINVIPTDCGRPVAHIVTNLRGYDSLVADVQATLDSLVPREVEVQAASGDWYLMGIRPYRTLANAIEGAVITFVDITEVMRVRDDLAAARALNRLAAVVRDANDAIVVSDLAGTIVAWNPAATCMYGWTEAEALGMPNADRIVPAQRKGERGVERGLIASERLAPRTTQRLTSSGEVLDVWATSSLLVGSNGTPHGIVTTETRRAAMGEDGGRSPLSSPNGPAAESASLSRLRAHAEDAVREQERTAQPGVQSVASDPSRVLHELRVHQVELETQNEELRLAYLELERSRERYRALYDLAPVGYLALDGDGKIVTANLQAATLLGVSAPALTGQPLNRFVAPADQDTYYQCRRALHATGAQQSCELRFGGADAPQVCCQVEASAVEHSEGATRVHVVLADVTQRKAADALLATAQKLESIGLLAAGIAHDFNNVLSAVLGNLSLLEVGLPKGAPNAKLVEEAADAARAGKGLAQQLLTFSAGGAPTKRVVDLRGLVSGAAAFAVRGSASVCEFELGESPLPVNVDEAQLSLLIQNLVINAVQAVPRGGRIAFAARHVDAAPAGLPLAAGPYVKLTVTDQGPGLTPAEASRVFEPYYSTKTTGRGLGLATALSVATKHGGTLGVASAPGEGACFTIYLPAVDALPGPDAATPMADRVASAPHSGGPVLLLEDDEWVARVLVRMFKQLGFEPTLLTDGAQAVPAWLAASSAGRPFHCAVFDLTIRGGMGGGEAAVQLLERDPDAKVIVSSGYSDDDVMSGWREYGFRAALKKPFTLTDLTEALRQLEAP